MKACVDARILHHMLNYVDSQIVDLVTHIDAWPTFAHTGTEEECVVKR